MRAKFINGGKGLSNPACFFLFYLDPLWQGGGGGPRLDPGGRIPGQRPLYGFRREAPENLRKCPPQADQFWGPGPVPGWVRGRGPPSVDFSLDPVLGGVGLTQAWRGVGVSYRVLRQAGMQLLKAGKESGNRAEVMAIFITNPGRGGGAGQACV